MDTSHCFRVCGLPSRQEDRQDPFADPDACCRAHGRRLCSVSLLALSNPRGCVLGQESQLVVEVKERRRPSAASASGGLVAEEVSSFHVARLCEGEWCKEGHTWVMPLCEGFFLGLREPQPVRVSERAGGGLKNFWCLSELQVLAPARQVQRASRARQAHSAQLQQERTAWLLEQVLRDCQQELVRLHAGAPSAWRAMPVMLLLHEAREALQPLQPAKPLREEAPALVLLQQGATEANEAFWGGLEAPPLPPPDRGFTSMVALARRVAEQGPAALEPWTRAQCLALAVLPAEELRSLAAGFGAPGASAEQLKVLLSAVEAFHHEGKPPQGLGPGLLGSRVVWRQLRPGEETSEPAATLLRLLPDWGVTEALNAVALARCVPAGQLQAVLEGSALRRNGERALPWPGLLPFGAGAVPRGRRLGVLWKHACAADPLPQQGCWWVRGEGPAEGVFLPEEERALRALHAAFSPCAGQEDKREAVKVLRAVVAGEGGKELEEVELGEGSFRGLAGVH